MTPNTNSTRNKLKALLLTPILGVLAPVSSTVAEEKTIEIEPTHDAFVDTAQSGTCFGASQELWTGDCSGYMAHGRTTTYLTFDLSAIPAKSSILDAKLKLFCVEDPVPWPVVVISSEEM